MVKDLGQGYILITLHTHTRESGENTVSVIFKFSLFLLTKV